MYAYVKTWLELKTDKRAVTALEYGLIAACIAGVLVAVLGTLGGHLSDVFTAVDTAVTPKAPAGG